MDTTRRRDRPALSDRDLVIAFKQGDGGAYDEIYRRHGPKIRVVCSRRLGHYQDAEEALQETFLRAYQALPRFNGQYKLAAWLNRIAINVCIDHLRTRSRTQVVQAIEDTVLEAERGPEEIIASRQPEVIAALGELKPIHARALRLRAVDGLSHEELAGRLEMTPAQVKTLLHRARTSFKRVLQGASSWLVAPFAIFKRSRSEPQAASIGGGAANVMGFIAGFQAALPTVERVITGTMVAALAVSSAAPHVDATQGDLGGGKRKVARAHPAFPKAELSAATRPEHRSQGAGRAAESPDEALLDLSEVQIPDEPAAVEETAKTVKLELRRHETHGDEEEVSELVSVDPNELEEDVGRKKSEAKTKGDAIASKLVGDS